MADSDMLQATPLQLRSLILDYLSHNGYTETARAFMRDSAIRHIDLDGDELAQSSTVSSSSELLETTLKQDELRNQIRLELLCGRVDEATNLLNKYFPVVLSLSTPLHFEDTLIPSSTMDYLAPTSVYPSHLVLNLRIQAFAEACRTIPLPYPPVPPELSSPSTASSVDDSDTIDRQTALLKSAQKLYALVRMLPSKEDTLRYRLELESVSGLLAYPVPENSTVSEYLSQSRREAVAEQIDCAILYHSNRPVISYLELYTRYTSAIWGLLNKFNVKPQRDSIPPAIVKAMPSNFFGGKQETQDICPPFDLHNFVDST